GRAGPVRAPDLHDPGRGGGRVADPGDAPGPGRGRPVAARAGAARPRPGGDARGPDPGVRAPVAGPLRRRGTVVAPPRHRRAVGRHAGRAARGRGPAGGPLRAGPVRPGRPAGAGLDRRPPAPHGPYGSGFDMNGRRSAAVLLTLLLGAPPTVAQVPRGLGRDNQVPFGQQTHAFRAVLFQAGARPLTNLDWLSTNPANTVL